MEEKKQSLVWYIPVGTTESALQCDFPALSEWRCFLWDICDYMAFFIQAAVLLPSSSLGYQPAVNSKKQRWQGRGPDFICDVFVEEEWRPFWFLPDLGRFLVTWTALRGGDRRKGNYRSVCPGLERGKHWFYCTDDSGCKLSSICALYGC